MKNLLRYEKSLHYKNMPMQYTEIFSSPEPKAPASVRRRLSVVHHFQRSSLKPLGQSKPNFI